MYDYGQHFLVGLSGTTLTNEEKALLAEVKPLGIIIFRHNIDQQSELWPEYLRSLILSAQEVTEREEFIVSIDHEGGRVHRLRAPATHFPAAVQWGDSAFAVGAAMGRELHSLGINLNFAPSVDLLTEPTNTVIGPRAFGSDPEQVAEQARAYLRGMKQQGVMGCAKHFPGHGSTKVDSHFELPQVDTDLSTLRSREFAPFSELIREGVPLVMTGHLLVPALDERYPATISKKIITEYLRQELGFAGAVVTDALEMRAMQESSIADKAKLALEAGTDLLLAAQPYGESPLETARRMISELKKEEHRLTPFLTQSSERLAELVRFSRRIQVTADSEGLGQSEAQQLAVRLAKSS